MKRYFTLVEVLLVVVILGIIATIGIPLYRGTVERAKAKACEANLKVIHAAVEVYGLENDILPATLSQLEPRHFQKAWAQVLKKENGLLIKIANFIVDFDRRGMAYAEEGFLSRYLKGESKYLVCPSDLTPFPSGVSYGLNAYLKGMSFKDYNVLQQSMGGVLLIGDCDQPYFSSLGELASRHNYVRGWGSQVHFVNVLLVTGAIVPIEQGFLRNAPRPEAANPPPNVNSPWTNPGTENNPELGERPVVSRGLESVQLPAGVANASANTLPSSSGQPSPRTGSGSLTGRVQESVTAGGGTSYGGSRRSSGWPSGGGGGSSGCR